MNDQEVSELIKLEAINFAKFAMQNTLQCSNLLGMGDSVDSWTYEPEYGKYEDKTDDELYELYLQSKNTIAS